MSSVYVTGVAGFLGSHLADALIAAGHRVVGCDNLMGGEIQNVPKSCEFFRFDCRDLRPSDFTGIDVLYHCAATAYEGLSVFSPAVVSRHIVDASVSSFSAAICAKVRRIVFCSSMARYGVGLPPFHESDLCDPIDPYGISKVCAEKILRCLCGVHGVEWSIAVPHNIYGPRQKYDDPYRNVASIMMNRMLQGLAPVIYGDGTQKRCFSYVDECVDCLMKMGFRDSCAGQVINIGPDLGEVTINELAHIISEIAGYRGKPHYVAERPQEVKTAYCSSYKARALLDYVGRTTLHEGLTYMFKAMKERGPKPFDYHLPIEIDSKLAPATWRDRLL
jgi:UDP-glucose 4-epimerase